MVPEPKIAPLDRPEPLPPGSELVDQPPVHLSRWFAAGEVLLVFAACQLYLWHRSRTNVPGVLLIFLFMVFSVALRRVGWQGLGLSFRHGLGAGRWAAVGAAAAAVPIIVFGMANGRLGLLLPDAAAIARFAGYFAWCVVQQFALQSYVHNRLLDAVARPHFTSAVVGLIFGSLHLPNPVLTAVTLTGGWAMGEVFARHRNIWLLALVQAVLGIAILVALPDAWHHRLRVGPGYFWWGVSR